MHRECQNNGLVRLGIISKIPFDDSEVTTKLDERWVCEREWWVCVRSFVPVFSIVFGHLRKVKSFHRPTIR